ncbi:MAG: YheU family protein [Acidobacteriota bacterium]|nr:YheU family protein [Acidobacteriota bacterium]MDH3784581.1 YheU family protein [Acidobacteriota bacterium]
MIIPHRQLSGHALAGVIEEYVSRDGTELGDVDDKAEEVVRRLDAGDLILVYDPESEGCNIILPEQLPK